MPTYVFKCENGHVFEEFLRLADYDDPQTCQCGLVGKRQIVATMIRPDIASWDRYISPASGKLITSYKDRRADMEATGCVDYEPSLTEGTKKRIAADDAKMDKAVEETVERHINTLDSRSKEQLGNEMERLDIDVVRQSV